MKLLKTFFKKFLSRVQGRCPCERKNMICNEIRVRDFRNVERAEVTFAPGVNILFGNNAQGKTNLLEAIYYVAIGKSFRGAKNAEIVRFGERSCEISLDFTDSLRKQNITIRLRDGAQRTTTVNGCRPESLSETIGVFRSVLFCPEHLLIVKEGPQLRRNYLDVAICQLKPMYLRSLQRYNQILKQRNALLKRAEEDPTEFRETIEFWSLQLAKEASLIAKERLLYVRMLDENARAYFSEMTGGNETPSFRYVGTAHRDEDDYLDEKLIERRFSELLLSHHDREIGAGTTLWGTHRDDVLIELNGKPARIYASQGQQRSLSLAMKLSESEISKKMTTEYPVLLLDDVLSELDKRRREYLLSSIRERQVIMTTCEEVKEENARIVRVENGRYF